MLRPALLTGAALVLLALAGCDFTPTLDIPTPDFGGGMTVNAVLFADSTVEVRLSRARDPYSAQVANTPSGFAAVADAVLTLTRDGGPPETLRYASRQCEVGYDNSTGQPILGQCGGVYVSVARVVAGATYTLRAEAPGLPSAEARVRVPARPAVTGSAEPGPTREGRLTDRVTLRLQDAPDAGQWYGIDVAETYEYTRTVTSCTPAGCRDTTITERYTGQNSFTTSDAILLAALRGIPGTTNFVTFSDPLFNGQERAFTIDALRYPRGDSVTEVNRRARVIAFDRPLIAAYEQAYFSLGEGNPFVEPQDPFSNVQGGYGLVGAAAITEIALPLR